MRFIALIPWLLLAACDARVPTVHRRLLPDELAVVVRLTRGGYASVLVEMERPARSPLVRMKPGIALIGRGWVRNVEVEEALLVVTSSDVEGPVVVDLDGDVVRAFDETGVILGEDGHTRRFDITTGQRDDQPGSPMRLDHPGPGSGFDLRVNGGRLELRTPRAGPDVWFPLLQGVDGVLWSWWLHGSELPQAFHDELDRQFKECGVLRAVYAHAVVDGNLSEWKGQEALAVDSPTQVIEGETWWSGRRDASFGVAARVHPRAIYLAVRILDDQLLPGEDELVVLLGDKEVALPIAPGEQVDGDMWQAVFTPVDGHEVSAEIWLYPGELRPDRLALPVVLHFVDRDRAPGLTRLGTAAWPSLVGVGYVVPGEGEPLTGP